MPKNSSIVCGYCDWEGKGSTVDPCPKCGRPTEIKTCEVCGRPTDGDTLCTQCLEDMLRGSNG